MFITTHQPYFIDGMNPDEVWVLEKQANGFSSIRCVGNESIVKNMVAEGLPWAASGIVIIWMRGNPMHFEILVEDPSGKKALSVLVPKIIDGRHTFNIHAYKGIGRIPIHMKHACDAGKQMLLNNLSKLLRGYGKTFSGYPEDYPAALILVCDLDDQCLKSLSRDMFSILDQCQPKNPILHRY